MKAQENLGRGSPQAERHRRLLYEWLKEWRMERVLAHGMEKPLPPPAIHYGAAATEGTPIRVGDVRLLKPEDRFSTERPRYLLVVRILENGMRIQIVPFGRFTTPGLPGEWCTGREAQSLAVLCAWNAREALRTRVVRSWRVARFSKAEIACVEKLIATCAFPDAEPPPELADGVGPPLIAANDPRWEYLREESDAWDALEDAKASVSAESPSRWLLHEGNPPAKSTDGALPLAAESAPTYRAQPRARRPRRRGCTESEIQ